MNRRQLEHVIRAAAATADVRDIVVIGSQAILGAFPDAPPELLESMEADVFPLDAPEHSTVIDGAIGELSLFHQTFGYHAHGVDDRTAILPPGWQDRLVRIENDNTRGSVGWCLEPHDLAVSKLAAGREKDFSFVERLLRGKLISEAILTDRFANTPAFPQTARENIAARIKLWTS